MNFKFNYNKKFQKLFSEKVILNNKLISLLKEEIVIVDGCYYYKFLAQKGKYSEEFGDRTGNECFFNNILIDDFVDDNKKTSLFNIGLNYSIALAMKLKKEFSPHKFNVIFSNDGKYNKVTFHMIRNNERLLLPDLDSYKMEAIIEISG